MQENIEEPLDKEAARRKRNNRRVLFITMAGLLILTELVYFMDKEIPLPEGFDSVNKFQKTQPKTGNSQPPSQNTQHRTPDHEPSHNYADSMSAHQLENASTMRENPKNATFQKDSGKTFMSPADSSMGKLNKPANPVAAPNTVSKISVKPPAPAKK